MKNRYVWSKLNRQQIGAFCEYFVKMELTMHGLQVYGTEVDDRGVDFVARYERGPFLEIQVKSLRSLGYVFMQKDKFPISESTWLALGLLFEGTAPQLFLVPSIAWRSPNALFADRNYEKEGLKSPPEWGLNISNKNMSLLEPFRFDYMLEKLQVSN
jgi:hypothetical protein